MLNLGAEWGVIPKRILTSLRPSAFPLWLTALPPWLEADSWNPWLPPEADVAE